MDPDPKIRETAILEGIKWIDVAHELGTKSVRGFEHNFVVDETGRLCRMEELKRRWLLLLITGRHAGKEV